MIAVTIEPGDHHPVTVIGGDGGGGDCCRLNYRRGRSRSRS